MSLQQILIRLLMLSLLLAGGIGVSEHFGLLDGIIGFTWNSLLFFSGVSLLVLLMAWFIMKRSPSFNFTNILLLAITLRMFLSATFIVVYIIKFELVGFSCIIPFFSFYLIYTWFENTHLLKYAQYLER